MCGICGLLQVTDKERRGSELDYIKMFGKEWLEAGGPGQTSTQFTEQHPRYQNLIKSKPIVTPLLLLHHFSDHKVLLTKLESHWNNQLLCAVVLLGATRECLVSGRITVNSLYQNSYLNYEEF